MLAHRASLRFSGQALRIMAPITRSLKRPASPEEKIQVLVKIEPNASAADLGGGDLGTSNGKPTGRRPKPRVKIEYEEEKLQSNEISTASGAKVGQGSRARAGQTLGNSRPDPVQE